MGGPALSGAPAGVQALALPDAMLGAMRAGDYEGGARQGRGGDAICSTASEQSSGVSGVLLVCQGCAFSLHQCQQAWQLRCPTTQADGGLRRGHHLDSLPPISA